MPVDKAGVLSLEREMLAGSRELKPQSCSECTPSQSPQPWNRDGGGIFHRGLTEVPHMKWLGSAR